MGSGPLVLPIAQKQSESLPCEERGASSPFHTLETKTHDRDKHETREAMLARKRNVSRNYHVLSVPIASISWGGILLPRTGEGDLGSPNVWGYVLSYLSTVVYHNANANINSHNPPKGDRVWLPLILHHTDGRYVDRLRATSLIITG